MKNKISIYRTVALLSASLAVGSIAHADDIYMSIKGRQGEFFGESATVKGRTELLTFGQGISMSNSTASATMIPGRRSYSPLTVSKYAGPASLQIWQAMISGQPLSEVSIDFVRPDSKGMPRAYQTIRLTNVLVTGFNRKAEAGPGKPSAIDEIAFAFSRIEVTDTTSNIVLTDDLVR